MLKVRVLPTLLFRETGLVKGVRFDSWRRVGSVTQAVRVYNLREVDELVFLDIRATQEQRAPDYELVREIAGQCFMPLTVGGGIRSLQHVRSLLQCGADKVSLNTAAVRNPGFIGEIAGTFGSQCVVVSIDARRTGSSFEAWVESGTAPAGVDPVTLARRAESHGAGEILLTSIDRDGTMEGYDLELIRDVSRAVGIPVIASGGAGHAGHMADAIHAGASAVAAGSLFHFTEQTPLELKRALRGRGVPVRE